MRKLRIGPALLGSEPVVFPSEGNVVVMVNVSCGEGVVITHPDLVNLRDCRIGANSRIGPFVEIMGDTIIGQRCKISSHSFICANTHIEDGVFVGHGVAITDEQAPEDAGRRRSPARGGPHPRTSIGAGASIGSRATVLAGRVIGTRAMIGAGAVVAEDVPDFAIVVGVPGRIVGDIREGLPAPGRPPTPPTEARRPE